jgi:hypothetical protein
LKLKEYCKDPAFRARAREVERDLHIASALNQSVDLDDIAVKLQCPIEIAAQFVTVVVITARDKLQFIAVGLPQ